MCGIAVVIDQSRDRVKDHLGRIIKVQRHRGPDGTGQVILECLPMRWIGLGHNRLAILDLTESGSQPMHSRDGRHTLVFNGEIYNYVEIASELGLKPTEYDRPIGDTRVLVEAIARWGCDVFRRLRGMWALACLDHYTGRLLLSRDRFGIKPMYISFEAGQFRLASEVKGLLVASKGTKNINQAACARYVAYGQLNSDLSTMFEGIAAFPPACHATLDLQNLMPPRFHQFWEPPAPSTRSGTAEDVEELKARLHTAISIHLRSDVPVGMLLSGGIDSSAILGFASKNGLSSSATALSVISNDAYLDESRFIDIMVNHTGVKSIKVNVSENPFDLLHLVGEATWANDQPLCGLSDASHFLLMQIAKSLKIHVLLSGQGSDEQFGGYNKFFYFYLNELIKKNKWFAALSIFLRVAFKSNVLQEFRIGEAVRYLGVKKIAAAGLIHADNTSALDGDIGLGANYVERERRDLFSLSLPMLLHYEDRMSMWNSIEVRLPFLDHRIVELALSLNPWAKFSSGQPKSILRKALVGVIPDDIRLRRDKKGFGIPEGEWVTNLFRPIYEEMMKGEMRSGSLRILSQDGIRRGYRNLLQKKPIPNGRQMMRVLLLERFLAQFSHYITGA